MIDKFQSKYERKISLLLDNYASLRFNNNRNYTGQFIDKIGIEKSQYGIYGMSVYIYLSKEINISNVNRLRGENITKLKDWVNRTVNYNIDANDANDFKNRDPHSYVYELSNVVSKIIYTYYCLAKVDPDCDEARILKARIYQSKNDDNGLSFLINSPSSTESNIFSTSQVLRAFINEDVQGNLDAIDYLLSRVADNPKASEIFKNLYVLNSIQIFLIKHPRHLRRDKYKKVKARILSLLRILFSHVEINPISFANPINVDFNDYGRTRYFRLYSDLILLESLIVTNHNMLYLVFGKLGKSLILNINESLDSDLNNPKDTTGHRMSFGYFDQLSTIIELLDYCKDHKIDSIWAKIYGGFWRLYNFGIDITEELFLTVIPIIIGIILFATNQDVLIIPWFGYMTARLGSFVSLLFKNHRKNRL